MFKKHQAPFSWRMFQTRFVLSGLPHTTKGLNSATQSAKPAISWGLQPFRVHLADCGIHRMLTSETRKILSGWVQI